MEKFSPLKKRYTTEEISDIPIPERWEILDQQRRDDFIDYYGDSASRLLGLLEKDSNNKSLIHSVITYGMYLPDLKVISKQELERRASDLFKKSGNILERVYELRKVLENSSIEENKKQEAQNYADQLYYRAIKLLYSRFQVAQQQNEGTVHYLRQTESIEKDLEMSDQELFLNLYWFKYAREKTPPPTIEELIEHSIEKKKSNELSQEEQKFILSIYQENWKHEEPEFMKRLLTIVSESFLQKDSEFILIRNHKEIAGFIRFQDYGDYEYASALNIKKEYQSFGIAEAVLESSIQVKSLQKPVHAQARLGASYLGKYFDLFNAYGTSIEIVDNVPLVNIVFSPTEKKNFTTSNMSPKEIVSVSDENIVIQNFSNWNEISIPQGFVFTRYINDPLDKNAWYAVYEKVPDTYQSIKNT